MLFLSSHKNKLRHCELGGIETDRVTVQLAPKAARWSHASLLPQDSLSQRSSVPKAPRCWLFPSLPPAFLQDYLRYRVWLKGECVRLPLSHKFPNTVFLSGPVVSFSTFLS